MRVVGECGDVSGERARGELVVGVEDLDVLAFGPCQGESPGDAGTAGPAAAGEDSRIVGELVEQ
ncbi:hypothetical protein GCM10022225_41590 [Plantactinospora mayteni]|uniref:Uncharacterized protein n=1 Tax=Plantactinospora mayteni TaxID=566021 RepID=A0ABQ4EU52_9ACTN|nr:hypothetical protein Pma05_47560 [Plantactinospora mayteni]